MDKQAFGQLELAVSSENAFGNLFEIKVVEIAVFTIFVSAVPLQVKPARGNRILLFSLRDKFPEDAKCTDAPRFVIDSFHLFVYFGWLVSWVYYIVCIKLMVTDQNLGGHT